MTPERALDLFFAGSALVALGPALAVAAVAVVLDDGAPVLFRQVRLGRDRMPFEILKLRTMRDGAVTRTGRWLRATGLDELPQFLNVVRGDMSVVGPRPLTEADVSRLGLDASRFSVKPGITGLAQLYGGHGPRHSRRLDRLQIRRKSARLDVQIVAASFVVNVVGKKRTKVWLRAARRAVRGLGRAAHPAPTSARPAPGTRG
jgi:lipopolysaccharide/colanic/teichoic acid biosynthesis glycosyltransferase